MTKSTITREQMEKWVAQFDEDGGCDATDRQLEALIRQSLAAMTSEPVAEVVSIYGDPEAFGEREIRPLVGIQQMPYGTKLYRHAQQPVVSPELTKDMEMEYFLRDDWKGTFRSGWEACRAAMLQACTLTNEDTKQAEPVTTANKLGNSPVIPDGYVMVPKEATEEMIAAAMNCEDVLFNSDESFCIQFGNIYEAMLAAAPHDTPALNSLQSVDSVAGKWIPVSERMPDSNGGYLVWDGEHCLLACFLFGGFQCNQFIREEITHWMPLPEPPQEVK
ncbi:DUF551 domain-containing protein [Klebsiella oxytoca]|uniref:DUF551 domain-containing protein n=1 Tax=Klebsiella oxytoca TaxID=571 RepID=UPI001F403890|nr:DUF551 domain-containing protein [Klebsiella oxytoca]MCE5368461.1 DUF551 domain-containing protein [Klebsiella oxytoca]